MGDTPVDIKTTLLNGVIKEEVYVEKPLGVETHDCQTHVWKLKKALYEIRRHTWDNTYMRRLKTTQSGEDINLFYKVEDEILQRMTRSQMGARRTLKMFKTEDLGIQ